MKSSSQPWPTGPPKVHWIGRPTSPTSPSPLRSISPPNSPPLRASTPTWSLYTRPSTPSSPRSSRPSTPRQAKPETPVPIFPPIGAPENVEDYGVWLANPDGSRIYFMSCVAELIKSSLSSAKAACRENDWSLESIALIVNTPGDAAPSVAGYVTPQKLRPLLWFVNLDALRVQASHLELSADFLKDLARALPRARQIVLMHTGPTAHRRPVRFNALLPFARGCPRLHTLGVDVQMMPDLEPKEYDRMQEEASRKARESRRTQPGSPEVAGARRPREVKPEQMHGLKRPHVYPAVTDFCSPVRVLWVGRDKFVKGEQVLAGIRRVFPNVELVAHAWDARFGGEDAEMAAKWHDEIERRMDCEPSFFKPLPDLPRASTEAKSSTRSSRL